MHKLCIGGGRCPKHRKKNCVEIFFSTSSGYIHTCRGGSRDEHGSTRGYRAPDPYPYPPRVRVPKPAGFEPKNVQNGPELSELCSKQCCRSVWSITPSILIRFGPIGARFEADGSENHDPYPYPRRVGYLTRHGSRNPCSSLVGDDQGGKVRFDLGYRCYIFFSLDPLCLADFTSSRFTSRQNDSLICQLDEDKTSSFFIISLLNSLGTRSCQQTIRKQSPNQPQTCRKQCMVC
jgi:hypothetical protein